MSADYDMLSDDQPLAPKPGHSGQNGQVALNGHDSSDELSPMSDDDEVPLSQSTHPKSEPMSPDVRARKRKKPAMSSSSDDALPLAASPAKPAKASRKSKVKPAVNGVTNGKKQVVNSHVDSEGESEVEVNSPVPKGKRSAMNGNGKAKAPPKKKVKKSESDEESFADSEDDAPIAKKKQSGTKKQSHKLASDDDTPLKPPSGKKATQRKPKKEESDVETPKVKKGKEKVKKEAGEKESKKKKKEEEEEEVYRWWEQQDDGDGSVKWQTLEHNGVYFPPPYESLPNDVKMKYAGKPVDLPPESEEVAGFYAALIETDHAQDKTFNNNFFDDWLKVLKQHPPRNGTKIKDFTLCDFRPIFEYFEAEKAKKKALSAADKKALKADRDKLEAPYTHCVLDGRKEKVGNFRVEPPGLFRGRGDHPKKGALKYRVRPEDITINIGEGVPTPKPNMPGKWKSVIHDNTVTWLANWTENVNGSHKYVFLAAGSSLKGQSDMSKFDKSRELKKHVDRIRKDYTKDLKSKVMQERQRATAMYFIDRLALRAGNEKGDDEADTVGCCSLRCEHVTLEPPNFIVFDFLGKDSIRYYNRVAVDDQVFRNIKLCKNDKEDGDDLFDRVETTQLNKYLQSYMKGLTAKVFRTYNASITFQQQLDEGTPKNGTVQEKLNAYNHANRMVAILCNHQRAVPKTHEQSMGKMKERLRGFKYERMKLRHVLFGIDPKFKKNKLYRDDESDLDDDDIVDQEEQWKAKEIEKLEKKFQKDNEKLVEEGKDPQDKSVLKEKIKDIEAELKRLEKERGTGKASLKRERPTEKLEEAIVKLDEKIKTFKLQMEDREAGKEVALGTSKINYLDPRITAAWCKMHDVPVEKIFSKTLLTKFPWAMEVEPDWKF